MPKTTHSFLSDVGLEDLVERFLEETATEEVVKDVAQQILEQSTVIISEDADHRVDALLVPGTVSVSAHARPQESIRFGATIYLQLFHTDVDKIDSIRKGVCVDHDLRRPIFAFSFNGEEKAERFYEKYSPLALAHSVHWNWPDSCGTLWAARNPGQLNRFAAWLTYVLGAPAEHWCYGEITDQGGGTALVGAADISLDDFKSILLGEKTIDECEPIPGGEEPMPTDEEELRNWSFRKHAEEQLQHSNTTVH